jgi:hypothetical protein
MWHVSGRRSAPRVMVGLCEARSPPGGPKHTLKDDIKIYLEEIGWVGYVWIVLFDDRI